MGISAPVALLPCAYLERATAHVLLGWLPKVVDIDLKLSLARQQHQAMARSIQLERMIESLSRLDRRAALAIPRRWRDHMQEIDGAANEVEMLRRLHLDVKPALAATYRRLLGALDPIADAPIRELVARALSEHEHDAEWLRKRLRTQKPVSPRAWSIEPGEARLPRKRWLWRTRERVTTPARPAHLSTEVVEGSLATPCVSPGRRSTAVLLHGNIDAELTTMELFARSSYEHTDLPEAFHRDMSRQAADEGRHAQACMDLAARYGAPHGTWPTTTEVYDFHYQFAPCKPGSRRELLWRLLLRSTLEEALSLDGFTTLSAKLAHDGAHDAARLMESILADEVFHVEAGLKWSRFLCGNDDDKVFVEREAAHRHYVASFREARRQYVEAHLDDAVRETERFQRMRAKARARYPFDLHVHLARPARASAGFTERDLRQVVSWGYVQG